MPDRSGVVLLDKPEGITSHDAVAIFRRASGERKTGHTGTLDPMATGLLVLCVGRATRLQSFLTGLPKTYTGEIRFGWATDTYDREGEIRGEAHEVEVSEELVRSTARERFTGEIDQVPPAYSAKKIAGRRAYELARAGEEPVLEPRRVKVSEFTIDRVSGSVAAFTVRCSAGTYVRSLAHDLGEAIGVPAHLASLRRVAIGSFDAERAVSVDRLRELDRELIFQSPHFLSMGEIDLPMPRVLIDPAQENRLLSGQSIVVARMGEEVVAGGKVSVVNLSDELVAIGEATHVSAGPVTIQPRVVLKQQ